jgi:hypothetical protein
VYVERPLHGPRFDASRAWSLPINVDTQAQATSQLPVVLSVVTRHKVSQHFVGHDCAVASVENALMMDGSQQLL